MVRIKNVRDKIYLLIYTKPRYAFELSDILYGRENKAVFAELKKLENENWIEGYTGELEEEITDGRSGYRKYYNTKIDPIINFIETIDITLLDENDLYPLRMIVGSRPFRYLVEKNIPTDIEFKENPINAIDFILTFLDYLFIISEQTEMFKKLQPGPRKIGDYEKAIEDLKNNKRFIEKTPKILELLYNETNVPDPVKKNLSYLFIIPRRLAFNHPGFSDFGRQLNSITEISIKISNLLKT